MTERSVTSLPSNFPPRRYDIVMIDSNENKLRFAMDRLDIACVHGRWRRRRST